MVSPRCELCGGAHPTDVHAQQMEGKELEKGHEHAMRGVEYLRALLASEVFRTDYVSATTERALRKDEAGAAAQKALKAEQEAIGAEIKKRLKDKEGIAEEKALEAVRANGIEAQTAMDIKKQMKDPKIREIWGSALAAVKQELEMNNAEVEIGEKKYNYNDFDAAIAEEVTAVHAESLAQKEATLEALRAQFSAEAALHLENLELELQTRADDPILLHALEIWGMSPDSQGGRGEHGQGFHAGIAHFFEYRRGADKLGRFNTEPTIDNFIEFSNTLKDVLDNPDPASNEHVAESVYIKDEQGQARLMSLTTHEGGLLVSAFQRVGEPMRVITAISPYLEKQFQKDVDKELNPKDFIKLNELSETRRRADLSEYSP